MRTSRFHRFHAADALEFFLFEKAEQLGLNGQRHFTDFVEEQRAAAGGFGLAFLVADGAGEGAL